MSALDAALACAARGWHVFPVRVGLKTVKGETKKDVRPIDEWKTAATTDPDQIRAWWGGTWSGAGIGIACGPSGIVVVDGDIVGNLHALGLGMAVLVVRTPGGGEHWYYAADPERPVINQQGLSKDGARGLADGVDVRGDGGFVFAPGSRDPRGVYTITVGQLEDELTPVPDLVVERCSKAKPKTDPPPTADRTAKGVEEFNTPGERHLFTRAEADRYVAPMLAEVISPSGAQGHAGAIFEAALVLARFVPLFYSRSEAEEMIFEECRKVWGTEDRDDKLHVANGLDKPPAWLAELRPERADPWAPGWEDGAPPTDDVRPTDATPAEDESGLNVLDRIRKRQEYRDKYVDRLAFRLADRDAKEAIDKAGGEAEQPPPDLISLTDLLTLDVEPTRFRIDQMWPKGGNVVIAAQAKAGKTTLVGNLLRCLVDGDDFLGRFTVDPVTEGSVVVIDNEMPTGKIREWLHDQGIRKTGSVHIWPTRGLVSRFDMRNATTRARWAEQLRTVDCRVLIIDCLAPILGSFNIEEDNNTLVGGLLDAFSALAKEGGAEELVLVHHMGHQAERTRGASRLRDWPDAEWRLMRDRDKEDATAVPDPAAPRFITAYGRDVDLRESQVVYDSASRRLTVQGGSRAETRRSRDVEKLIEFVRSNPGCGKNRIKEALSFSYETITKLVNMSDGQIRVEPGSNKKQLHYLN